MNNKTLVAIGILLFLLFYLANRVGKTFWEAAQAAILAIAVTAAFVFKAISWPVWIVCFIASFFFSSSAKDLFQGVPSLNSGEPIEQAND